MHKETIGVIQNEYLESSKPWVLGFSGGKDSTAVLTLLYNSLYKIRNPQKPVKVVYCDTGVEIPIFSELVHNTFEKLKLESDKNNIPIVPMIVKPLLEDRYFSKVIGRGYATPTNKFRWCTDRLRIKPLRTVLDPESRDYTVLLGVRRGESKERDSVISNNSTEDKYYFKQSGNNNARIFSPIIEYTVDDVWDAITQLDLPKSILRDDLKLYYQYVGDKDTKLNDKFNGKGRFGCWTCTVVRKDKAVKKLIDEGCEELIPLYNYRNFLMSIRDDEEFRCKQRRNGVTGLGPFTLKARKLMLDELLKAQSQTVYKLIDEDEIRYIKHLWNVDINSDIYFE